MGYTVYSRYGDKDTHTDTLKGLEAWALAVRNVELALQIRHQMVLLIIYRPNIVHGKPLMSLMSFPPRVIFIGLRAPDHNYKMRMLATCPIHTVLKC